jgi:asparaginyl-tRNA synthetase
VQTNINGKTPSLIHPYSASYSRTTIKFILGADDGGKSLVGKTLVVGGWIKSGREQGGGAFYFIQINDGSIFTDIQVSRPLLGNATSFAQHVVAFFVP